MGNLWNGIKNFVSKLFQDTLINLLALLIFDIILSSFLILKKEINPLVVKINIILLVGISIAIILIIIWLFISRKPLEINTGRDFSLKSSIKLLNKLLSSKKNKKYLYSTRISFWPLDEESSLRRECRHLLSEIIKSEIYVKRLWQIRNKTDLTRMKKYLEDYKKFDNYNLRCFVSETPGIPEIHCYSGDVVLIQIPQRENPRKMNTSFSYYGKKEITYFEEYFSLIWESSIPIKTGNIIHYKEFQAIEHELKAFKNI